MDRSRRMPQRRRHLGASASPTSASEASFDLNPSTSPVVAHTNTTPQSVAGRRSTKPLQHAFTFSPPGNSRNSNSKKRSTTMDNFPIPGEGEHGPKKGGHSLRKRARVDYTFEHIDDDVVVPNSTSSARGKKRRSEVNFDTDDFYGTDSKRRGASMGADTPSNRRRNPSRKSSEMKAYHQAALQDDDNDVQDTIEVGVYYSDADDSELRETVGSNHSSPQSKMSPKNSPKTSPKNESTKNESAAPQIDDSHQFEPRVDDTTTAPEIEEIPSKQVLPVVEPTSNSIEEPVFQPAEPQTEQLPKVEPEPEVLNPDAKHMPPAADFNNAASTSEPEAVPEIKPVPEPTAVPEPEPEAVPAPASTPAPTPMLVTADENNRSELIHSHIDPASASVPAPEPVDGVSEVPTAEPIPQDTSDSFNTNHINIKGETDHHSTVEQAPGSPDQPSNQQQEDKMEIDLAQEEHPAQDVEMTDAVVPDNQEPALAPTSAVLSSPLPSKALSMSPPKSPSKSPSPPPAREIEQPQQIADDTTTSFQLGAAEAPAPEEVNGDSMEIEEENNENSENDENSGPAEVSATVNETQAPDSPRIPVTQEEPVAISSPTEIKAPTPPPADTIETPASSAPSETKSSPQKPAAPRPAIESMPQPTPVGRWAHLTPYVDGEFVLYPEKKGRSDEDGVTDDATPEGKDTDREGVDMEPMVDDQDDTADGAALEAPTPALNTPTRGSPVPDSTDLTAFNSPAPGGEDADDADVSESQELPERNRYFKYRKLRDPEEYISAIENYEDMSTDELYEILEAINVSMVQWQHEWNDLGVVVDDYENSLRRRAADAKYEARTRNLHQHGVNYEEPEFAVKGYKSRDKEGVNETRYLQGQDRIMAASYGFEYDPHPSKIGKQNPETQQVGIMTRGRSLRNQPRQTAKATETDEVVGKRQRKPVQLFDPATQDVSRSSTPVPTRGGRRRKNANADDDAQTNLSVSFNNEVVSDGEATGPKTRRKRGTRGKNAVPSLTEDLVPTPDAEEYAAQEELTKSTRRGRARPAVKYEEADPNEFVDDEPQEEEEEEEVEEKEEKPPVRRHLLTLKIPRGYLNEPTSEIEITDNGDSRPTTASSEESSHTAESSYSFRPKRQKRFRDDPDETEESTQAPPKKRGKRASGVTTTNDIPSTASTPAPSAEPAQVPNNRKIQKIKVVRSGQDSKNGGAPSPAPPPPPPPPAPMVEEGDDTPKDYKSMTKSEKMSASMKNRWANGNMAGAVEKRKATLAAKKAAQAAAEQRTGVVAPKPKGKAAAKRDATLKMQMQPDQPQVPPQQQPLLHQPPPMHPHQHQHQHQHPHHQHQHQHQHQHPPHPLHLQQQPPMHQPHPQHIPPPPPPPPHQAGNPPPFMHGHSQHHSHGHSHGMSGMGYPY